MPPLTTNQLETIRRLLLDPLRETIKAEIAQSHDRLESAIQHLAENFDSHITRTDQHLASIDREIARQKSFRRRLATVYATLTVLLSFAWSLAREKVIAHFTDKN